MYVNIYLLDPPKKNCLAMYLIEVPQKLQRAYSLGLDSKES